jgi:hypothetical protein
MKRIQSLSLSLLVLALPLSALAQEVFREPAAAAQALVDALGTENADPDKLEAVLGANWKDLIPVQGVARSDVDAFLDKYREHHEIEPKGADRVYLSVGSDPWVLPIPLARDSNGWRFDTRAGVEESGIRLIGSNELAAIEAVRAYHDAQVEYAATDRDEDGILEYAQNLVSADGTHDGLFWVEDESGDISPLGPLFGDSTPDGIWHGYQFRILTAQGPSAPGGAYDYLIGEDMTRGFALVAWPASYGDTGIHTFMISHEGEVFEKDLGPLGGDVVMDMRQFDPDDSWKAVDQASP